MSRPPEDQPPTQIKIPELPPKKTFRYLNCGKCANLEEIVDVHHMCTYLCHIWKDLILHPDGAEICENFVPKEEWK